MTWALEPPPVDLTWRLEPDEFIHLWTETETDDYPEPLRLRSSFHTVDESAVGMREISARYPLRGNADLSLALRILAKPAVRITMYGGPIDGSHAVRILGCRIQNTAVLAVQEPGPEPDCGGAVRIWLGEWSAMAGRMMQALPPTPPGRMPQLVASRTDVENEPLVLSVMSRGSERTPAQRIRSLVAAPREAQGVIQIERALLQDRCSPPTHFSWTDVTDDGRYLISVGYDVKIQSATPAVIAQLLC